MNDNVFELWENGDILFSKELRSIDLYLECVESNVQSLAQKSKERSPPRSLNNIRNKVISILQSLDSINKQEKSPGS